jgi:glycosyltransferase involved in cell wall biosynthesis
VVEGFNAQIWAERALAILSDGSMRARLIEDGILRASGYTWQRTASATLDVYRKVFGS